MLRRCAALAAPIYELRVYKMHPEQFPKYLQLTNEHMHLRTAHSKLAGFWLTEIGGQNEAVHIWEYDSLAHRKKVRDALGTDEDWKAKYLAHIRSTWMEQNNYLMDLKQNGAPAGEAGKATGAFYRIALAKNPQATAHSAAVTRLATFQLTSGEKVGKFVTLDRSMDLDALNANVAEEKVQWSKILFNAPWAAKLGSTWC